jgi:hypothetical protein
MNCFEIAPNKDENESPTWVFMSVQPPQRCQLDSEVCTYAGQPASVCLGLLAVVVPGCSALHWPTELGQELASSEPQRQNNILNVEVESGDHDV